MPAQLLCAALGITLLVSPSVSTHSAPEALIAHVFGPLVAGVGLVAAWDVLRALRWVNAVLGLAVIAAEAVVGPRGATGVYCACAGMLILLLSLVPGPRGHGYAGGWHSLR